MSGDSRDCGDLIMPKIAKSIESLRNQTPAQFYWHLGDFRGIYRVDCDMAKRKHPSFVCLPDKRNKGEVTDQEMNAYLAEAWDDFIQKQVMSFGDTPVFLGIGNHELINRTRNDFRLKFMRWLVQNPIHAQRRDDALKGILSSEGDTYYHFIKNGVDFIYLDNADTTMFNAAQIVWFAKVLALDATTDSVKTIIVGMHAALPYSTSRNHAMDISCQGICSGQQVYDLLYRAQNLAGPSEKQKHVYVLASHSHYFRENIFDTPEHRGQVLPGWIVGTAGAEQYQDQIRYGYLLVEVRSDGTVNPQFKEVTRDPPPLASGPGADELTRFCFEQNKRGRTSDDSFKGDCPCGAAR